MSQSQRRAVGWLMLIVLLAVGTGLRLWATGQKPLWDDEAESSINAQTILIHGVPTDRFLGQPIYENIMFRPWPGNREYEFKDLSYSGKGVVAYHGWLPLYSIAGSMALFDQGPDLLTGTAIPQHTDESVPKRTVVPRLPAVVFGLLFMVVMFALGRTVGGPAAGWSALVYAALAKKNVYYGSQARYYSLTLLLIAASGWSLWGIIRRGRWRDYIAGSLTLVLLFHTHIVSCFGMCLVGVVTMPWHRSGRGVWAKRGVLLLIVLAGTLPWIWWTGFLDNTRGIPSAWRLAGFWDVVFEYLTQRPVELGLFIFGVSAAALASAPGLLGRKMPERVSEAFAQRRGAYLWVTVWAGVMFVTFAGCMPAASFFSTRLSLMIAAPCMLLAAMIVSSASHLISPRRAYLIAPALVFVMLLGTDRLWEGRPIEGLAGPFTAVLTLMDYLRDADLPDDTRLYATPNGHLIMTYYTGLPIQSVSPIRKTFLDTFPGPVVIFEKARFVPPPDWHGIAQAASTASEPMTQRAARDWVRRINSRVHREDLVGKVADIEPALIDPPDNLATLFDEQRQATEQMRNLLQWRSGSNLMFRGFEIRTSPNWWQTYQYRFVDPASRSGENVNYADRVRPSRAVVVPEGGFIAYHCPPLID